MNVRLTALAAALFACTTSAWAATSNIGVYGVMNAGLPTHETYAAAAEIGTNFFTSEPYIPQSSITTVPGETASITQISPIPISNPYTASAKTTLGGNHAFAQVPSVPLGSFGIGSFSGWYDTLTINGGSGTGVMHFSVQLNGTVDAGAFAGIAAYGLYASSVHPTQLTSDVILNVSTPTNPWFLDSNQVTPITTYTIGASPYNDPSVLFTTEPPQPFNLEGGIVGIPALEIPKQYADLILTPGAGQGVNVTLTGTLNFTYGEAFYLIGGLGTMVADVLDSTCAFAIEGTCTPTPKDGTGATTLDFSNSANLINIALPEGATASFASGNAYSVTSVPEPGEWMLLLAGLGLVGWRVRRKSA